MRRTAVSIFLIVISIASSAVCQSIKESLDALNQDKSILLNKLKETEDSIQVLKHKLIIDNLKEIGLPSENYLEHSAMILEYSELHEQARWVAHMIIPDIKNGSTYRTNDFRIDPKVSTGTSIQADYFLTDTLANGEVEYDGFGYDRGHLAPSADFRWSSSALSESYFYSNISPQLPEFNREKWAELENHLRRYVIVNDVPLYIVTLPILNEDLPKLKRAVNNVVIPNKFAKVAYDPVNKLGIGFIMENKSLDAPLYSYAVSIDEVEQLSGLDVFKSLDGEIESTLNKESWFDDLKGGDVEPLDQLSLPKGYFNTSVAKRKVGKKAIICGHVVASRYSRKGHLWLNLDKQFPNQVFSVFIRKEDLSNFEGDVKERYTNQNVCVEGKVDSYSDSESINVKDDRGISFYGR